MTFIWPTLLLLMVLIPLGVWAFAMLERRRRRRIAGYGMLTRLAGEGGGAGSSGSPAAGDARAVRSSAAARWRRRVPAACLILGLTLVVLAIARPQAVVSVPRVEGTVILAFDVSNSMAATDLSPTRMEAAKAAALTFVQRQPPTVRIGVVAFSDTGFSIQVPTDDQAQITAAIQRLQPERGTAIARGILASLSAIATDAAGPGAGYYTNRPPGASPAPTPTPVPAGSFKDAVIVLLTDGENNQNPDPLEAAKTAADQGVRIYTVGIGTAAGSDLDIDGFRVHSQLDEAMLKQIASLTNGTYYGAADPGAFDAVYQGVQTRLVIRPEPMEVTSLFAGAGLLVLLVGGAASLVWLGRAP
jgi:Ca-activated chloride channel family protein